MKTRKAERNRFPADQPDKRRWKYKKYLRKSARSAGYPFINKLLKLALKKSIIFIYTNNFFIMDENGISYKIRGAIYNIYNEFGPGLLESVYTAVLDMELTNQGY